MSSWLHEVHWLWITVLFAGCATAGLRRTQLESWDRVSFDRIGVSVDLPARTGPQASAYHLHVADTAQYEETTGRKDILVDLHPLWSSDPAFEPVYLLGIRLRVFEATRNSSYHTAAFPLSYYPAFSNTNMAPQVRGSDVNVERFRQDRKLADGRIVVCEAQIISPNPASPEYASDTNAIRRIFASIQLVNEK